MDAIQQAYKVLGLNPGASIEEVKSTYRELARKFHPDINKAPDAQERFVEVHEAYDLVVESLSGRSTPRFRRTPTREEARAEARKKAYEFAKQRYEEYKTTQAYQDDMAMQSFSNLTDLFIYVAIIVSAITYLSVNDIPHATGIFIGLLVVSSPLAYRAFRNIRSQDWTRLRLMGRLLFIDSPALLVIVLIVAIFIFLWLGSRILITPYVLLGTISFATLVTWIIIRVKRISFFPKILSPLIPLLLIDFFLLLNHNIVSNPVRESYRCSTETVTQTSRSRRTGKVGSNTAPQTVIILENDAYESYPGIRFFLDLEDIESDEISYTFATGLFGIRVMKNREFIP